MLHDIQAATCTSVTQFYRTSYHHPLSLTLLPSHHVYRNMATTSLSASSLASIPPLLHLPAELHLDIVSELLPFKTTLLGIGPTHLGLPLRNFYNFRFYTTSIRSRIGMMVALKV
jgi:hypothetical protein